MDKRHLCLHLEIGKKKDNLRTKFWFYFESFVFVSIHCIVEVLQILSSLSFNVHLGGLNMLYCGQACFKLCVSVCVVAWTLLLCTVTDFSGLLLCNDCIIWLLFCPTIFFLFKIFTYASLSLLPTAHLSLPLLFLRKFLTFCAFAHFHAI